MSTFARHRLIKDFNRIEQEDTSGLFAAPQNDNILCWEAVIFGPEDTPWEGGSFKLILEFTDDYPKEPPKVRFITKMYHPNSKMQVNISIQRW